MKVLDRETFAQLVKTPRIKPRLRKILRFVPEEIINWDSRDFLVVTDKSRSEGVLIVDSNVFPVTLTRRAAKASGRVEAIICDICASWRRGTESIVITFQANERRTVSYLVCADLDCSLHVRDMTDASKLSRAQLREDIMPAKRIVRLHDRLKTILENI